MSQINQNQVNQKSGTETTTLQQLRQRNAAVKRQIREAVRLRARAYLEEEHLRLQAELASLTDGFVFDSQRYK